MITDLDILKKDLPYIYNIDNFLVKPEKYHPSNPKYIKQWNTYKKHCIEGLWSYDQKGWRFMPATLFYYANFFKLEHTENKQRKMIKPFVRDIDWLIHYTYLEALGFSGFKDDEVYTSDEAMINNSLFMELKNSENDYQQIRYLALYNSEGRLKTYVLPRQYIKQLHSEALGRPNYYNQANNMLVFGCRGGGKSYSVAGIANQTMAFDGLKEYTLEAVQGKPKVNISVGSGDGAKSAELVSKITKNFELHGTDPDFGVYGTPGSKDFEPGAFYINWIGSAKPNNATNPYRYEYDVETAQGWQTLGSGTKMVHVNYSEKKLTASATAAGTRNALNIYEEVGLMPNFRDVLLSNDATVSVDGERFGVQFGLGTSGDIEAVQQTKLVFNDPETYNFLAFDNIWEPVDHKIGLFIPAYLSDRRFKDRNGNTDIQRALEFFVKRREEASKKDDVEVLRNEKMNYPLVPSDMWTSSKSSFFPIAELLDRERELVKGKLFKSLGKPVKLIWDSTKQYGVKAELDEDAEPYYTYPFDRSMTNKEGCPIMYEEPISINGEIPKDFYIYTLDPYVSENLEEGGSIGAFQIWINKRYTKEGFNGDQLVFTYYGKHASGKDAFYEICEKAIQMYGNCPRMYWYEANRGDSVRGYNVRKNKTYLLCVRPTREKGSAAKERQVAEYGYMVSNKIDKLDMITDAAEWLLSLTMRNGKQVRVYETIPCLFTIQQLIQYTIEGNFDAVSALLGLPLALKEIEHQYVFQAEKKARANPFANLIQATSVNPNILRKNVDKSESSNNRSIRRYF